jgi:cytoskeletal protein CcmA (bactofilin family)
MNEEKKHSLGTVVDPRTALMGSLNTDRSLHVYGIFEGDLQVTNTVFIDAKGQVSADVTAERVVVQGTVVGNINARQVVIYANGKVWGDVRAQAFYVETGGFVSGQVVISNGSEPGLFPGALQDPDDSPLQSLPDDDPARRSVVEQEAVARDFLFVDECQDDGQTKQDNGQVTDAQRSADMVAQRQVARPVEKEAETGLSQADLETRQQADQAYTAYCLICHARRRIEGVHQLTLPNGRRAIKGRCVTCGIRLLEQLDLE